jgi:hypothetical protein
MVMSTKQAPTVQSATITLQRWLVDEFTERCRSTLLDWSTGQCTRSDTIATLTANLDSLACDLEAGIDRALLGRMAAATGVAMAIACRTDDNDADTSDDGCMVTEGIATFEMWLTETCDTSSGLDAAGRARWQTNAPIRLRAAMTALVEEPGDTTNELAACTGTLFALHVR